MTGLAVSGFREWIKRMVRGLTVNGFCERIERIAVATSACFANNGLRVRKAGAEYQRMLATRVRSTNGEF